MGAGASRVGGRVEVVSLLAHTAMSIERVIWRLPMILELQSYDHHRRA